MNRVHDMPPEVEGPQSSGSYLCDVRGARITHCAIIDRFARNRRVRCSALLVAVGQQLRHGLITANTARMLPVDVDPHQAGKAAARAVVELDALIEFHARVTVVMPRGPWRRRIYWRSGWRRRRCSIPTNDHQPV